MSILGIEYVLLDSIIYIIAINNRERTRAAVVNCFFLDYVFHVWARLAHAALCAGHAGRISLTNYIILDYLYFSIPLDAPLEGDTMYKKNLDSVVKLRLTSKQYDSLLKLASSRKVTVSYLLRYIINDYLIHFGGDYGNE